MKIKKLALIIIFAILLLALNSCSNAKVKFLTGNEQNNSVFLHDIVCEDENYVYVSGGEVQNIKRINKKDQSVTELNHKGSRLNIYDGYLYFVGEKILYRKDLYRLNLSDPNAESELVAKGFPADIYTIFNDKIYPYSNYNPIFRMNVDGSDMEEAKDTNFYHIFGTDDKYIYTIFKDYETEIIDGIETNIFYFSRMDHNGENSEKLFKIYAEIWADIRHYNDFLVISDGYAYYKMRWNGREEIIRSELTVNSEREVLYTTPENGRINMTAVTKDGIYFRTQNLAVSYISIIPNVKLSLDGKVETQIELENEFDVLPFFVSRFDGKLYYIKNDKIFAFEY